MATTQNQKQIEAPYAAKNQMFSPNRSYYMKKNSEQSKDRRHDPNACGPNFLKQSRHGPMPHWISGSVHSLHRCCGQNPSELPQNVKFIPYAEINLTEVFFTSQRSYEFPRRRTDAGVTSAIGW